MIVTIDGPAGAGKSTVAKALAKRLDFRYLDTGAMYRAVTWLAVEQSVDPTSKDEVAKVASEMKLEFSADRVLVNGQDVTESIRTKEVTRHVSEIADNTEVRKYLVEWQRRIAADGDYVCEGRDQATVAFPSAACKIFLTASAEVRARRRYEQLAANGVDTSFEEVLQDQNDRDQRDSEREVGRLMRAEDAVEVNTDGLTLEQVVDRLARIVKQKTSSSSEPQ